MNNQPTFTWYTQELEFAESGIWHLVYYWTNSTSAKETARPAAIDSVSIKASERCTPVSNFRVVVDTTSATLNWSSYNTDEWRLKVATYQFNEPELEVADVCDTVVRTLPHVVSGLEPSNTYYAYVLNPCDTTSSDPACPLCPLL